MELVAYPLSIILGRKEMAMIVRVWDNYNCSCLTCSGFAENDEVVAVEDFIDVGNILGKSWVSL